MLLWSSSTEPVDKRCQPLVAAGQWGRDVLAAKRHFVHYSDSDSESELYKRWWVHSTVKYETSRDEKKNPKQIAIVFGPRGKRKPYTVALSLGVL